MIVRAPFDNCGDSREGEPRQAWRLAPTQSGCGWRGHPRDSRWSYAICGLEVEVAYFFFDGGRFGKEWWFGQLDADAVVGESGGKAWVAVVGAEGGDEGFDGLIFFASFEVVFGQCERGLGVLGLDGLGTLKGDDGLVVHVLAGELLGEEDKVGGVVGFVTYVEAGGLDRAVDLVGLVVGVDEGDLADVHGGGEADGLLVLDDGFGEVALLLEALAEPVVCGGVFEVGVEGLVEDVDSFVQVACFEVDLALLGEAGGVDGGGGAAADEAEEQGQQAGEGEGTVFHGDSPGWFEAKAGPRGCLGGCRS